MERTDIKNRRNTMCQGPHPTKEQRQEEVFMVLMKVICIYMKHAELADSLKMYITL